MIMDIKSQIYNIFANDALAADDGESSKCEEIENLISVYGWDFVQTTLLQMLDNPQLDVSEYDVIAQVFWGAVLDKRDIDKNKTIALLYKRLPPVSEVGESYCEHLDNLIWSITHRLKSVGYLSEYDPLKDPDILEEMSKYK